MCWRLKGGHKQDGDPTLDNLVEIKTVGSNINFINMEDSEEKTSNGMTYSIKNNVLKIKGTATANNTLIFTSKTQVDLRANTYTLNANKNGSLTGVFGYYIYGTLTPSGARKVLIDGGNLASSTNTGIKTQALTENNYYNCCFGIYFEKNCTTDMTLTPKLEEGPVATPYSYYNQGSVKINVVNSDNTESQAFIMPIQQEMLEGDYVTDVEHHEWEKLILTGDEDWHKSSTTEVDRFSYNTSDYPAFAEGLSNYFLVQKGIGANVGTLVFNAGTQIVVNFSDYGTTTLEEFKAWLKSKYDAKNPVIVYYKLATPINLALTDEQKAVRDTKLNTYKNVTNISLSDELASIDVEYKKDLETINKNYENRLAALEAASIS